MLSSITLLIQLTLLRVEGYQQGNVYQLGKVSGLNIILIFEYKLIRICINYNPSGTHSHTPAQHAPVISSLYDKLVLMKLYKCDILPA